MLRALHHIMAQERPLVQGNEILERAHRIGVLYWRDYYGRVAMRELLGNIARGEFLQAGKTSAALARYVGFRAFVIPWKHRHRLIRKLVARFDRLSDQR